MPLGNCWARFRSLHVAASSGSESWRHHVPKHPEGSKVPRVTACHPAREVALHQLQEQEGKEREMFTQTGSCLLFPDGSCQREAGRAREKHTRATC